MKRSFVQFSYPQKLLKPGVYLSLVGAVSAIAVLLNPQVQTRWMGDGRSPLPEPTLSPSPEIDLEAASRPRTNPSQATPDLPPPASLPVNELEYLSRPVRQLPSTGQLHLTLDLSDRQVTLYQGTTVVKRYPVAIGRRGWETPTGEFKVTDMRQNPTWINPMTGKSIPGGHPRNPMGTRWIGFWTDGNNWIGFHGTTEPNSIGKAVSHGCVRMQNADIEELYRLVKLDTVVNVVP